MDSTTDGTDVQAPQWRPLESVPRRVLGVLIEKAKTTPDAYPLTLNAIKTGSNQKSNRSPQMQLDADDVQEALDDLREMGAVVEVQGDGRVSKYRHKAYHWLGVDKTELAVIAELLLRGQQTVGELRSRASRMEPIEGVSALRPILSGLKQKKLLVELTPEGRGQIVTHGLYPEGKQPAFDSSAAAAPATRSVSAARREADDDRWARMTQQIEDLTRRVEALESHGD